MLDFKKLQTKRKELASKIEVYLMSKEGFRNKIASLSKYLKYILDSQSDRHYAKFAEDLINSLGMSPEVARVVRTLTDNTLSYMKHNGEYGREAAPSKEFMLTVTILASKHIASELSKIVSIQPLTAPVGQIFSLRYKEDDQIVDGWNALDKDGNLIENNLEGRNNLTLEIVSKAIETLTRKLQTGWNAGFVFDQTNSRCAMDLETEMTKAVAHEVAFEAINEVVNDLIGGSSRYALVDEIDLDYSSPTPLTDSGTTIVNSISSAANRIAAMTRRGSGNVVVCSPTTASILSVSGHIKDGAEGGFKIGNLMHVGTLVIGGKDTGINVYSHIFAQAGEGLDYILVGYKGASPVDAGYIYSPFLPVNLNGRVLTDSLDSRIQLTTRYGKTYISPQNYRLIKINTKFE